MAKTKGAKPHLVSVPQNSTVRLQLPRNVPAPKTKGRRGRRKGAARRGGSRRSFGSGLQDQVMDIGWALLALEFAAGAIGDKLPILIDDAGLEGSMALALHFFEGDKYVKGIEEVSMVLALKRYLDTSKPFAPKAPKGEKNVSGFGL